MMKSDNPIVSIYVLQRYLRASADKGNLRLIMEPGLSEPYTKKGTVYIPAITGSTTQSDIVKLIRFVDHEAAHHRYNTDFGMMQREGISASENLLAFVYGMVEDMRVDHHDAEEWLGDAMNMSDYYDQQTPGRLEVLEGMKDDLENKQQLDCIQSLLGLDYETRNWLPGANLNTDDVMATISPEAKALVEKMESAGVPDRINALGDTKKDSEEAWKIAQEIYEDIFQLDLEAAKEQMQEEKQKAEAEEGDGNEEGEGQGEGADAEGEDGDQEGKGQGNGDGDGDGDGKSKGAGEYGNGGSPTWDISNAIVKYKLLEELGNAEEEYGATGIHLDYSDYIPGRDFVPLPYDKLRYIDFEKGTSANISKEGNYPDQYKEQISNGVLNSTEGRGLANKVRRLLQIRSRSQRVFGQKKGKLDSRNLHRVTMKDAPGYNQRVFKQKIDNDTLDTAVMLLVDFSGSMGGDKIQHAIQSSMLLYEAISRSLHIPLEIVGFSETGRASLLMTFKSFDGNTSSERLVDRMIKGTDYMSQNADGEAIAYVYDKLAARKEKRKIMIVLSDGSPACSRSGDIYNFTYNIIKGIEEDRHVDIYGIGIMDNNVERLYEHHRVINSAEELEDALLHVIEKRIM